MKLKPGTDVFLCLLRPSWKQTGPILQLQEPAWANDMLRLYIHTYIPAEQQPQQADWTHWNQPLVKHLRSLVHSLDC